MNSVKPRADALVFFGAAGDLAYKKIFPALQAMARRGKLDFPVVGMARAGWSREQLIEPGQGQRRPPTAASIRPPPDARGTS